MIRIDAVWLAEAPLDMGAGMETALARVITVFGSAQPQNAYAYLKDVLERLPSQPASRVGELFPHRWSPA